MASTHISATHKLIGVIVLAIAGLCVAGLGHRYGDALLEETCYYGNELLISKSRLTGRLTRVEREIADVRVSIPAGSLPTVITDDMKLMLPFIANYTDGGKAMDGVCPVTTVSGLPFPRVEESTTARCYSPSGELVSKVTAGNGRIAMLFDDGVPYAEVDLEHGRKVKTTVRFRNGDLQVVERYKAGVRHGTTEVYSADGKNRVKVLYEDGREVGRESF